LDSEIKGPVIRPFFSTFVLVITHHLPPHIDDNNLAQRPYSNIDKNENAAEIEDNNFGFFPSNKN